MTWSKTKQQLESFLCPSLIGRVEYRATSYRYAPDKSGRCYITVDKKEVFNMCDLKSQIQWYKTEQEIKDALSLSFSVAKQDLDIIRDESNGAIPEDRIYVIARNRKLSQYAKDTLAAQACLSKSDFYEMTSVFLSSSVDDCLKSKDILLNIFALIDRRVGKKRLQNLREEIYLKHPIVQYFYELRCSS